MRRLASVALALTLGACVRGRPPSGLDEPGLIALRRQIHQNPELAGHEGETAARVAERLRALDLEVHPGVGGHGIVAILRGARPGPVIAYRAELDAVADDEQAPLPFRSIRPGSAHLCGHDIHIAVAVGIAEILAAERAQMRGTLKLLFQPAEENLLGARAMIAAGALAEPTPREIYAVHAAPAPVGIMGYGPGVGQPGLDRFELVLPRGTTVEDAEKLAARMDALSTVHKPNDAAAWKVLLAQLTAEPSPLADFTWITTHVERGVAPPVIHVFVRTAHDEAYEATRVRVAALAPSARLIIPAPPFPGLLSDAELSTAAVAPLSSVVGREHLFRVTASLPFNGDDFALYLQRVRGAIFWLGVADPAHGLNGQPHAPDFQADERAIAIGARAMAALIRARLAQP
jgi:metal-dependent amidase/aminoacylase/carboxypeptidase family protein